MEKFLIIDGNSIMNRAFYGLLNVKMLNKKGVPTNAVFGFLNIYWMMLEKLNPDYVAVSFDLKAPTFRHKMYSEYKGTRKGMPDDLRVQMPYIKQILEAMNIPVLQLETYEADDILGTVALENMSRNIFTYILTGDRDAFQLISDQTSVVMPSNKPGNKTDYTIYTPQVLMEKYHITPAQVIEVKALMGDSADNIPGVKGIGEKTAYTLIGDYGDVENVYQNIDSLSGAKLKEKLVQGKEMAILSKKLATIDTHVPIEMNYQDFKCKEVNKPSLYSLFKELEFQKFLSKYDFSNEVENDQENKGEIATAKELIVSHTVIVNASNFSMHQKEIEKLYHHKKVSYLFLTDKCKFDTFKAVFHLDDKKLLALYDNEIDTSYILELSSFQEEDYIAILKEFCASKCYKIGYNIKQDIRYFFEVNIDTLHHFDFDLMIPYYLLDAIKGNYPIETILHDLYNYEIKDEKKDKKSDVQMSLFENESEEAKVFLTEEDMNHINSYLKGLFLAHPHMMSKLKANFMLELFETIEMPLVETLASMEHTGMYIDLNKLDIFSEKLTSRLQELEIQIYHLAGEEFNINSTQQLGTILFEKLDLPIIKKTKTGYSTDKDVLDSLADRHPIINLIIEYRQTMKLYTTFVEGLKSSIKEDSRIHTTFMQTVTATGRLSSVEPNLQNIPVRLELGKEVRSFFAGEGEKVIVDADYSQIELRVLAHISHDETMIHAFQNEIDIHKVTASQVFNIPLEEVTPTMRTNAKAVNFGIVYGISDFGLAKNIGTSKKEAAMYIKEYLLKYHGIARFMEMIVKEAKVKGYVTTLFGRRRYIPELVRNNRIIEQFGERVAMNTPIQGSAADIIKIAMNNIYKKLKKEKLKSKLVMQVHDELIIETVPEEIERIKTIMKEEMENVIKLDVPLKVDLEVGKTWYDTK